MIKDEDVPFLPTVSKLLAEVTPHDGAATILLDQARGELRRLRDAMRPRRCACGEPIVVSCFTALAVASGTTGLGGRVYSLPNICAAHARARRVANGHRA
jgi:hypothetical protein